MIKCAFHLILTIALSLISANGLAQQADTPAQPDAPEVAELTIEEQLKTISNPFETKLPIEAIEEMDLPEQGPIRRSRDGNRQGGEPSEKGDNDENFDESGIAPNEGDGENRDGKAAGASQNNSSNPIERSANAGNIQPGEANEAEAEEEIIPIPSVIVSGIIWNSDRPQAIIDGSVVDIGDNIKGIIILEIEKSGINGTFQGRSVSLSIQRSI